MANPLVFISHSSRDKEVAIRLASEFRDRGLDIWIDHERIEFGESIPNAIEKGLTQSQCLVVIVSQAFRESKWCRAEYEPLLVKEIEQSLILVIPILIESCEMPTLLSQKLFADLREQSEWSRQLDILANQIRQRFGWEQSDSISSSKPEPQGISDASQSNGESMLVSLRRRLEDDFFVSGQRKGEFGKSRIPNEAHLYHGRIRERLEHKPYYFLTYWGWEAMSAVCSDHRNEWANLTEAALKRRLLARDGSKWIWKVTRVGQRWCPKKLSRSVIPSRQLKYFF